MAGVYKSLSMLHGDRPWNRAIALPLWTGEPLDGRTVALLDEEGFGDSIDLMRYVRFVKERDARVMVVCRPELFRLYSRAPDVDDVIGLGRPCGDKRFGRGLLLSSLRPAVSPVS
jgi:hypothetical protein